ncbi:putative Mrr-like endonuclease [Bacillus cereus]|uniref:Putative Mrr-like endonuclease n=1 Tax=Bacillus cereus TaxID=1396 RepID=A0A164NY57_BACCE|nr:putative Mrr-like endonuclease [Bacillus cereus]
MVQNEHDVKRSEALILEIEKSEQRLKEIENKIGERQQEFKAVSVEYDIKTARLRRVSEELETKEQLLRNIMLELEETNNKLKKQIRLFRKQKELMEKGTATTTDIKVEYKGEAPEPTENIKKIPESIIAKTIDPQKLSSIFSFAEVIKQYADKKELEILEKKRIEQERTKQKRIEQERIRQEHLEKKRIEDEKKYRQEDKEFDELFNKFVELHDVSGIFHHNVDERLLTIVEKKRYETTFTEYEYSWEHSFYTDSFAPFLTVLRSRNYRIEGKEGHYVFLLKEKALHKNFRRLSDDFIPLFKLSPKDKNVVDVIHSYIRITGEESAELIDFICFLAVFLKEKGFMSYRQETSKLAKMVNSEKNNYKARELERLLLRNNEQEETEKVLTIEDIDLMTGEEFEKYLADLLKNLGFETKLTKGSGDQGVDIIASRNGNIYAIQAKRYTGTVGNDAVQQAISGKGYIKANEAWVITNSTFTRSAIDLATQTQTKLWDRSKLQNIIEAVTL